MLLHMGIPIWNHNQMNVNPIFNTMKQSSMEVTKQRLTNILTKHKPSFKLFYFNFKQDNKATKLDGLKYTLKSRSSDFDPTIIDVHKSVNAWIANRNKI